MTPHRDGRAPGPGRRAVPVLLTAAGVTAVILGLHAVVGAGSAGVGPGPDDRVVREPSPPPEQPLPRDLDHATARVTSYAARGRLLTIDYAMTYPDCLVVVVHPQTTETPGSVIVQLQRVAIRAQSLPTCPTEPVDQTVSIRLRRPVADRPVLDHADGDRPIPLETSTRR